jgi:alkanesulfonate monooxygenase SsuD/methylene tetrahydromethanopterin reductase-like flavin-dependent oxidoreductase (luciferase family)
MSPHVFATLDAMFGGRAAWNVVISLNNSEAANFGQQEVLPRYDRAEEFMEVMLGPLGYLGRRCNHGRSRERRFRGSLQGASALVSRSAPQRFSPIVTRTDLKWPFFT